MQTFTFDIARAVRSTDAFEDAPPKTVANQIEYRVTGDLSDYLGVREPSIFEVFALRLYIAFNDGLLNAGATHGFARLLRPMGNSWRVAESVLDHVVVIGSFFINREILFEHAITRHDALGDMLAWLTYTLWLVYAATLFFARSVPFNDPLAVAGQRNTLPWVMFNDAQPVGCFSRSLFVLHNAFTLVLTGVSVYVLVAHTYNPVNGAFAGLLLLRVLYMIMAAFEDTLHMGTAKGFARGNARRLMAARITTVVPIVAILTAWLVAVSDPWR